MKLCIGRLKYAENIGKTSTNLFLGRKQVACEGVSEKNNYYIFFFKLWVVMSGDEIKKS